MDKFSYIANAHPSFIEDLYSSFKKDEKQVEEQWRDFFKGFDFALQDYENNGQSVSADEFKVFALIQDYRRKGHLLANTNPIRIRKDRKPNLSLADFGLKEADKVRKFVVGKEIGLPNATLGEIIAQLELHYGGKIGFEVEYIENKEELLWLRSKIENKDRIKFNIEQKKRILEKLNQTVVFENFLNKKYVGQKRFSLEGGESTIPGLDAIINQGVKDNVEEVVIGMAHRGRLNVLATLMGKTYEQIFKEFEGDIEPDQTMGDGDVKYHLGYSSQYMTPGGHPVDVKLVPNPSHLEAVDSVVGGFARAKSDLLYGSERKRVLPLLIHGDAAVVGQGVVYETVQMSQLAGYYVGGTVHFIINNQIGFTTNFDDARSSTYSTGAASMIKAPVFHVNGDDVESVVWVSQLAAEYRHKFQKDVFIDMVCYRKHGHNEGDDPKYTQPAMYAVISKHPDPREIYVESLTTGGSIEKELAESMEKDFWAELQNRLDSTKEKELPYKYQETELQWKQLRKNVGIEGAFPSPNTGISEKKFNKVANALVNHPEDFKPLRKIEKLLKNQREMFFETKQVDWALAELMAYGSLLEDGHHVRMSGQDVKRGTFSHRHAMLMDSNNYGEYYRLAHISEEQGRFSIYNSLLSEFGVLGFEYGYSMASPSAMVIWEAQFGDFSNGAQTIMDQFISAGESKWRRMSGLVMLLPHGYAGQGPEHSSARLERYLQLCGEFNMSVVNITEPANFFHALRRQLVRDFRKPLIVMSPKSLLRHPKVKSPVSEILTGSFQEIIDDRRTKQNPEKVKRILFCSGKIYYDLLQKQENDSREDVAIVRLEQLYPLHQKGIEEITRNYKGALLYWVQEEPENMGAWRHILSYYPKAAWNLVSRKTSASPATGFKKVHEKQQRELVEQAFA